MAIRVELEKTQLQAALVKEQMSLRRAINTNMNPLMKEILSKDLAAITKSLDTLTEVK